MSSCRSDDCRSLRELSAADHIGAMAQATKESDCANGSSERQCNIASPKHCQLGPHRLGW